MSDARVYTLPEEPPAVYVYLHQVGSDQESFFRAYSSGVLPRLCETFGEAQRERRAG